MAKNDPDGKGRGRRQSFSDQEADVFRDRASSIERGYQAQVRRGLLSLANANLAKASAMRTANQQQGQARANVGSSGLQAIGARTRAAQSERSIAGRESEAVRRLAQTATRQELDHAKRNRDADHAINLRDLLAGRHA